MHSDHPNPRDRLQDIGKDIRKVFTALFVIFVAIMGSITLFAYFLAHLRLN